MKLLFILSLLVVSLFANVSDANSSKQKKQEQLTKEQKAILRKVKIDDYVKQLAVLDKEISKERVWMKSYSSYITSLEVRDTLKEMRKRIKYLKKKGKTQVEKDELNSLISKESILAAQVNQLKEKDSALFSQLLTPPFIGDIPTITNPFDIFTGISLIKTFDAYLDEYEQRKEKLTNLIALIREENKIYSAIAKIDDEGKFKEEAKEKAKQLERFEIALDTIVVTAEVYEKRLEVLEININKDVETQVFRLVKIGIIIFVILFIFFLLKLVVKKYITDNDRFYMANKVITFTNVTVIILVLFFNYIENASYLVTILGFASAGIAIAMKDWFMSILGWLVIVFGGSIHVGDRIRVDMDGMKYVGDVMDISLLRMTILEDITLTSIMQNRRAGRIIFVPNNYVFTRMIANYTHSSLKTVWDGVKITITFDSNHKKAMHIAKEITKKFSKGYTDITRKQLNKLRQQYSLKNTNVEPRIFSFIESNGIDIEAWYLTNAYATLTLRSVISTEIVDAFNAEDDINIAYPTQKLHLSSRDDRPIEHSHEVV
jgi:small-conductance mechanosensitive channel